MNRIPGHPTNLDPMVELVEIHDGIYGRLYLEMMAQDLKNLQKFPTVRMKLACHHVHRGQHSTFKGS